MDIFGLLDRQMAPRLVRGSIVLAVSLTYFSYVFQVFRGDFLTSGLDGWLDPYFLNYVLEHWYHSLWSFADPASPGMYFPARGALGYSCGLILYAPFYVIVRPFLHPFVAYNVALLLVMETGVVCLYIVFRKFLALGFIEALLLSAFFFSSRNVINAFHTNVWSQTASIFLVPAILLLALVSVRRPARWQGLSLAGLSGLLCTLLFSQDFYTGWFTLLLSALLTIGALLVANTRVVGERFVNTWKADRSRIVAFVFGASIGVAVFLWIYLGAYREYHGFPEEQLRAALVSRDLSTWHTPIDAIRDLVVYASARPFKLVFIAGVLAWVPWFKVPLRIRLYALWFLLVSAIVALGAIRFEEYLGWKNYSIWKRLFSPLPGYAVIREPKRMIYTYELTVALFTGLFLAQLPRKSVLRISIAVLVFLLLVTEPNREVFRFARPTTVYNHWVDAPIQVDSSCRSFFIKRASAEYMSRSGHIWSLYGIDAMFIALNLSIPTLNGYTAWQPPGWGLADPPDPEYPAAVHRWLAQHPLPGVCELDIDARTMTPYEPLPEDASPLSSAGVGN